MDSDAVNPEVIERAVKCPACDYDLRAQLHDAGATCPECGRSFTLKELRSDRSLTEHERGERLALMLMPTVVLGVATFLGLCMSLVLDPPPWLVITLIIGAVVGSIVVTADRLTIDEKSKRYVRRPILQFMRNTLLTLLITLIAIGVPLVTCLCMGVLEAY